MEQRVYIFEHLERPLIYHAPIPKQSGFKDKNWISFQVLFDSYCCSKASQFAKLRLKCGLFARFVCSGIITIY